MAPGSTSKPAASPADQPTGQPGNQPAGQSGQPSKKPADGSENPAEGPGAKPAEARRDLSKTTNENVTGKENLSKEDQELVSYVESLGIQDPNFRQLILFFARMWTGLNRIASNFSLFDDMDKTPKGNKLKPEDETKVKELWKTDFAKIDQATIYRLNKLGNEAAATSYVCVALGISEMTDPRVLLESLDNVKMGENKAFSRIATFDELVNQKPLKKGTVVFSNFNLLTGELIPFIATGNEGELKMLYPDLKADSKNKDLPKIEQSIYAYDGEPSLTRFQFRAALMPTFAVSAQDSIVDAGDDSDLGKILAYEPKTKELFTDIANTLEVVAGLRDDSQHGYKVGKFGYILEPLAKISNFTDELVTKYLALVKENPALNEKLLPKLKAAHAGYKDLLTKIMTGIDNEIAPFDEKLEEITHKMSSLNAEKARLEGEKDADGISIAQGELDQQEAAKSDIERSIKEFNDARAKFSPYSLLLARLTVMIEDQIKPGEQPVAQV